MIIYLPALACLIGGVYFLIAKDPDRKALAKDCFWAGLLVLLFQLAGQKISLP